MIFHHAAFISPSDLRLGIVVIAVLLVIVCLRLIADEIAYATKSHNLLIDVQGLRARQAKRLKSLGLKSRH